MSMTDLYHQIFTAGSENMEQVALALFDDQYANNPVYRSFVHALRPSLTRPERMEDIPFLPIQFFKSQQVIRQGPEPIAAIFESSGTTLQIPSRHYVKDIGIYQQSFLNGFEAAFGPPSKFAILALLPSYQERGSSSLVYMVDALIRMSGHAESGFFLHEDERLFQTLQQLEQQQQPAILFGVTYALLDFADRYPMSLKATSIIETGGMKGRREELLREEVHLRLMQAFGLDAIASEYGMTELLSQAYSKRDGRFTPSSTMKVLVRDLNDPLQVDRQGKGLLNIIDLANFYSCPFIATDDLGEVFPDASFTVDGRLDGSELRGCSLMVQ